MPHVQIHCFDIDGKSLLNEPYLVDLLTYSDTVVLHVAYPILKTVSHSPAELYKQVSEFCGAKFVILAPTSREETPGYRKSQLEALSVASSYGWPSVPFKL